MERFFLHDKFYKANIRHPYFWTGLIWATWHLPLILFSDYATSDLPYFSAAMFVVVAVTFSIFMGWQREVTGSVWVAGMAHVSHNMWMQTIYPRFLKKGPLDQYFGGESGVFLAVIYSILAIYIWRRRKDWRKKSSPQIANVPTHFSGEKSG